MSETATKKKEPGMATLVIVLFAICAATALLLGLTNYVTAPFIAANNEKTTQEAMAAVLPADSYDEVEYTGGDAMVQAVYKAGDAGYVVEVKPATSFSGNLTIMVGVDNTGACSGISITSTGETSGLGSNASKPDFQAQFVGKTGEVKVTKDGGDIDALTEMVDRHTCAVMLELVQGEGGVNPATPEFMTGLRKLCDEKGILLLLDEVQTGWCRTGAVMSYMNYGIKPDIVSMAKGLGGGMPIGAICATEEVSKAFSAGSHGTTFGGHPVCCAAALAEVNELLDRDLAGNAKKVGDYFAAKLEKLPHVKEVRHQGLLVGVEFDDTISGVDVKHGCFDRHMLITAIGSHIIRMVPPLIVSEEECDKAFDIIKETVESLS